MLNIDLIKNILIVSMACGIINTAIIQKIKEHLNSKKYIVLISFIVSMVIGTIFSLSFSNINLIYSLWAGLFSFIDANMLYVAFEDKIFKSFNNINETIEIERSDE